MQMIDSICNLYREDSRTGDCLLSPQRWCHRQWDWVLFSTFNTHCNQFVEIAKRTANIALLTLPTMIACVIGFAGIAIKAFSMRDAVKSVFFFGAPGLDCVDLSAKHIVNDYVVHRKVDFYDSSDKYLFTDVIGYDSGRLTAKYQINGKRIYLEEISPIKLDLISADINQQIKETAEKHLDQVRETLNALEGHITEQNKIKDIAKEHLTQVSTTLSEIDTCQNGQKSKEIAQMLLTQARETQFKFDCHKRQKIEETAFFLEDSVLDCVNPSAKHMVNDYEVHRRFDFYDSSNKYLFTDVIGYDLSGRLTAEYQINGKLIYPEEICPIKLDLISADLNQKIEKIVEIHLTQVIETLNALKSHITEQNKIKNIAKEHLTKVSKALSDLDTCLNKQNKINEDAKKYLTLVRETLGSFGFHKGQKIEEAVEIYLTRMEKFLGEINNCLEKQEIGEAQKHLTRLNRDLVELNTCLEQSGNLIVGCRDLSDAIRGRFPYRRGLQVERSQHFIALLEQKIKFEQHLQLHIKSMAPKDTACFSPEGAILDYECSLDALFAKLLVVNFHSSENMFPGPMQITDMVFDLRRNRYNFIETLIADYKLYFEGKLVYEKKDGKSHIYDLLLFEQLCKAPVTLGHIPEGEEPWLKIIDDSFVKTAIQKEYIPAKFENNLVDRLGRTVAQALDNRKIYGNIKKREKIENTEVAHLNPLDQFLFNSIGLMCGNEEKYAFSEANSLEKQQWDQIQKIYPFLSGGEVAFNEAKKQLEPVWVQLKNIYQYLSGKKDIFSLKIKPEFVEGFLKVTNMFEIAMSLRNTHRPSNKKVVFQTGSYDLRLKLVEMSSKLSTLWAFKVTLFPEKLEDETFIKENKNFIRQRRVLQVSLLEKILKEVQALSEDIDQIDQITAARGNTAAGKSTAFKELIKLLGKKIAILNPDNIKFNLQEGSRTRSHQVHEEAKLLFEKCIKSCKDFDLNYLVDLRLKSFKDIQKYIIEPAKTRNLTVSLCDYDVPLLTTVNRVLTRKPNGEDPIPPVDSIVSGLIDIRKYRKKPLSVEKVEEAEVEYIIDEIVKSDIIKEYKLYYLGKLVAEKNGNEGFIIHDLQGYAECIRVPSEKEINDCLDLTINDDYIKDALDRGDFKKDENLYLALHALFQWEGSTVREALQAHADGIYDNKDLS